MYDNNKTDTELKIVKFNSITVYINNIYLKHF